MCVSTFLHKCIYMCIHVQEYGFFFHGQCEFKDFYEKYMVGALGMEKEDEKM